ncbi:MAG: hypothetical protein ACRENE_08975 [Polyangiaceae bacterium]
MMLRRSRKASEAFAERRRVEDEAQRLAAVAPQLLSLRLEIEEDRGGAIASEVKHVRHVVVAYAPALFVFPCGDDACKNGGHDMTYAVLNELRGRVETFALEDACYGDVGSAPCGLVVHVTGKAAYRAP